MQSLVVILLSVSVLTATFTRNVEAATSGLPHSDLRLINAGTHNGTLLAGIDIVMEPHVKTYWRMPGDSGLPPIFDWSASDNLATILVLWPLPDRIQDPAGTILGYYDDVIFPVQVTPKDPTKPVHLILKLDYAVCGELCVPMTGRADVTLSGIQDNGPDSARVNAFLARVPRSVPFGVTLTSVSPDPNTNDALLVTVKEPLTDLFVEGPEGWYFGDAKAISPLQWRVLILQHPTTAVLSGAALVFTLISNGSATETKVTLDATGAIR
jgi:DsbC/DsbD-like thiol-disulfide interchange protein